ncbi:MAG TPA: hypothetical protein VL728_03910 [Cyclobacteriaceae bacterium]|jgi:hypothetical protein|nr:hypothetical protein [Cyclobacteriaceae bacterium]
MKNHRFYYILIYLFYVTLRAVKGTLDIIEGKRILIAEEIEKCYKVGEKIEHLKKQLFGGQILTDEFEKKRRKLLWEYDTHTIRLHRKLLAVERKK